MASKSEIMDLVISPMSAVFGKPYGCETLEEISMAQAEYISALETIPSQALALGWKDVRNMWEKRVWPPVAVIAKAAREHVPPPSARDSRRISESEARGMLRTTPQGRLAMELMVPASFVTFCTATKRCPTFDEVRHMGRSRLTRENVPALCAGIRNHDMRERLLSIGLDMVEKNEKLLGDSASA